MEPDVAAVRQAVAATMILLDPALASGAPQRNLPVSGSARSAINSGNAPTRPVSSRPALARWAERIPSEKTLAKFAAEAQAAVRLRGEVNILLTTDKAIRKLNRDFRGKNKATDVLSFPAEAGFVAAEIAGDLAISVETALKQARAQGHALTCELKVLVLHGLLHLAGYDHETDTGQMARRERKLRDKLRLPVGLIERVENKPAQTKSSEAKKPAKKAAKKSPKKSAASRVGR
ncbi:MAG: rRNA maturation RNase YbeY [Terracidiphilus sp.]|nr:rRNA maturation RNase YbeY [Terracidiphilus sp.]